MSRLKVTIVMPWYAPYRLPLLRELSMAPDIQLTVIFSSPIENGRQWRVPDKLPFNAVFLNSRPIVKYKRRQMFDDDISIQFPSGLLRALRSAAPRIVVAYEFHLESMLAALYAHLHQCKFLIWSDVTAIHDARMGRFRIAIRKLLLSKSHALIGSSSDTVDHFHESFGYPIEKSFLSILSAHVDDFIQTAATTLQGDNNRGNNVRYLYVGGFSARKGVDLLLRAFSQVRQTVPNAILTLVGDGPQKRFLESLAITYGCNDSLTFKEFMPYEQLASEMRTHDVFVFPTRLDVFGLVVAEAIACGLPIVCSRWAGAARDLVLGNGIIVDPLNIDELASAMRELAMNAQVRSDMRLAATTVLRKHNMATAVNGYLSALRTAAFLPNKSSSMIRGSHDFA